MTLKDTDQKFASDTVSRSIDPPVWDSGKTQTITPLIEENKLQNVEKDALAPESTEEEVVEEEKYPEGSLRAWLVVFGSWCALFAALGLLNTLGTFQSYISTHQLSHYSDGTIGWIFSIYTFMAWFCGIFIGPLFDKWGPKWLILAGSVCVVGAMMLLGECTGMSERFVFHQIPLSYLSIAYWHFIIAFGIIAGFGTALLFTPPIAAVGHFFKAHRGHATGIACTGGSIGGIVFSQMLQELIPKVGFAWSTRIVGFVCLLLCIIANILISSRLPPSKTANAYPDLRIFKKTTFSLTTAATFLIEWGVFIPLTYIISYALSSGFKQDFAYQMLPIMNAGSFFGRWIPGFYSDKIGAYNAIILSVCLNIITVMCIWLPVGSTKGGLIAFSLLFGFASGSNVSLTPVCIGQLCPTENYGRYYATCYALVSFGCLTGIPIAGEILVHNEGRYWGLMIFVGMCYVGALAALVMTRVQSRGWKLRIKY
jgi:MFS family permease